MTDAYEALRTAAEARRVVQAQHARQFPFQIIDTHTNIAERLTYKTLRQAMRAVDALDSQYGASRYAVRRTPITR